MMNPFNRFYDTKIDVYENGQNTYTSKGEKMLLGNLLCDIQPYESDTQSNIYGLSSTDGYKIYCDKNELIKKGRYINFGGEWYMIVKIFSRNLGMTAAVRSVENEG